MTISVKEVQRLAEAEKRVIEDIERKTENSELKWKLCTCVKAMKSAITNLDPEKPMMPLTAHVTLLNALDQIGLDK